MADTGPNKNQKTLITLIVVIVIGALAYSVLTMPDQRTTQERVGDAVSELPDIDKAARELEQRTPGEKLGDAIKDSTDNP